MDKKKRKKELTPHWGALVWVKWKPGAPDNAWEKWPREEEIKEAWSMSGDWDCSLWLYPNNFKN
jgi:hypothetical protein